MSSDRLGHKSWTKRGKAKQPTFQNFSKSYSKFAHQIKAKKYLNTYLNNTLNWERKKIFNCMLTLYISVRILNKKIIII